MLYWLRVRRQDHNRLSDGPRFLLSTAYEAGLGPTMGYQRWQRARLARHWRRLRRRIRRLLLWLGTLCSNFIGRLHPEGPLARYRRIWLLKYYRLHLRRYSMAARNATLDVAYNR